MSRFEQKTRYAVAKIKDLSSEAREAFFQDFFNLAQKHGAKPINSVVVEDDWPIYEPVWDMVQRMDEKRPQKIQELSHEIKSLKLIGNEIRHDLLTRAQRSETGQKVVNVSDSLWKRFCEALAGNKKRAKLTIDGLLDEGNEQAAFHALSEENKMLHAEIEKVRQERNESSTKWRTSFDNMHQRAMRSEQRVNALESMSGQVYQAAGAYNLPERVLDVLSDMMSGDVIRHNNILPVMPIEKGATQ